MQPLLCQKRLREVLGYIGEAKSCEGGIQHLCCAVEGELPLDSHFQFAVAFLEFPSIDAAVGRKAKVDAVVGDQLSDESGVWR